MRHIVLSVPKNLLSISISQVKWILLDLENDTSVVGGDTCERKSSTSKSTRATIPIYTLSE